MKKIRTLLLTLALCLSLTPATLAAGLPFTDVTTADWFYGDVERAVATGLVNGKTSTEFRPDESMTFAEAIKLAACMHQQYYTGSVTLTNGAPNWYDSYVDYAQANGIPYLFGNYDAPITRAGYVHVFYSALPVTEFTPRNAVAEDQLPDVYGTDPFAKEIYTFYRAGILTGNDVWGSFSPESNIRRGEVAAVLSRMTDASTRKTFTLQSSPAAGLVDTWHIVDYTVEGDTYYAADVGVVATLTMRPDGTADFRQDEPDGNTLDYRNMTMERVEFPLYDGCANKDWCVIMDNGGERCQLAATRVGDRLILLEQYPEFFVMSTFVGY